MDGEDALEDGIYWLSVSESVSDEAEVSRSSSGMQPQISDWRWRMSLRTKRGELYEGTHTLWLH